MRVAQILIMSPAAADELTCSLQRHAAHIARLSWHYTNAARRAPRVFTLERARRTQRAAAFWSAAARAAAGGTYGGPALRLMAPDWAWARYVTHLIGWGIHLDRA